MQVKMLQKVFADSIPLFGEATREAAYVIAGIPFDGTSSFRPGSRYGPSAIRESSSNFESYLHNSGIHLLDVTIVDAGDLEEVGSIEDLRSLLAMELETIFGKRTIASIFPIFLGGEHSLTPMVLEYFSNRMKKRIADKLVEEEMVEEEMEKKMVEGEMAEEVMDNKMVEEEMAEEVMENKMVEGEMVEGEMVEEKEENEKAEEKIGVIYLDAHMDMRAEYLGIPFSHACAARRTIDVLGSQNIIPIGVRSFSREEHEFLQPLIEEGTFHYFSSRDVLEKGASTVGKEAVDRLLESGCNRIYLSVDMDVFDPSIAPAVGNPEPGGLSYYDFLDIVQCAAPYLCGMDLVEISPEYDQGITALLGAKIIMETIGYHFKYHRDKSQ